eukprot:GABV01003718.1.p1 GENE.GABV01003718.1~~GABV01003718.1.p1  ORF type:complete len:137 (-),score=16.28 GABV01003718.1:35-445(-)
MCNGHHTCSHKFDNIDAKMFVPHGMDTDGGLLKSCLQFRKRDLKFEFDKIFNAHFSSHGTQVLDSSRVKFIPHATHNMKPDALFNQRTPPRPTQDPCPCLKLQRMIFSGRNWPTDNTIGFRGFKGYWQNLEASQGG